MSDDRDKGAVQHLDSNSKRLDKGAVEKNEVAAAGGIIPQVMHQRRQMGVS